MALPLQECQFLGSALDFSTQTQKHNPNPEATFKNHLLVVFVSVLPNTYLNTLCTEVSFKAALLFPGVLGGFSLCWREIANAGEQICFLKPGFNPPHTDTHNNVPARYLVFVNATCHLFSPDYSWLKFLSSQCIKHVKGHWAHLMLKALGVNMSRFSVHSTLTPRFSCLLRRHPVANSDLSASTAAQ